MPNPYPPKSVTTLRSVLLVLGRTVVYDSRYAIDLYTIAHNNAILTKTRLLGIDPHICRAKSTDPAITSYNVSWIVTSTHDAGVAKNQSLNSESRLVQHP